MATKKDSKKTTSAARKRTPATANTSPPVASVPDEIAGVKTAHIKPELIKQALKGVGLDDDKLVTELIPDLVGYYKGNYTDDDLYECDVCGGPSVEADEFCPFCGEEGIEEDEPAASTPPEQKLVKTNANKKTATKAAPKPSVEKKKPAAKATTKKATAKKTTTKKAASKPATTTAIVPVVDAETKAIREKFTPKDLDKKVAAIHKSMSTFAECSFTLGTQIKELHDTDMWKVRADDSGRVAYTNFKRFCEAELGMTSAWAYNLIEVATHFDKGIVKQLGTEKCKLLLRAPEDNREDLLAEAKAGISKRELQKKINEAKAAAAGGDTTASGATPPKDRPITAVLKPCARKKVKMYKSKGVKKSDDPVRAVRLTDEPEFVFESENGVTIKGKVVQSAKNGELELVLTIAK